MQKLAKHRKGAAASLQTKTDPWITEWHAPSKKQGSKKKPKRKKG